MKIDIQEEEKTVTVTVSLKPINRKENNIKIKMLPKDILNHLKESNIKVGKCIKCPLVVTNLMGPEYLFGEWVYEKEKPKTRTPRKESRNRRKKSKKILDKTPESVIIVEEKKQSTNSYETPSVTEE